MTTPSEDLDLERHLDAIDEAILREDRATAIALAISALHAGIEEPLVLVLAAERFEEEENTPRAAELLKKAASLAPDEAEVWRRLGGTLARQGLPAEAIAALDRALALDPASCPTLVAAGATSFRSGNLRAADAYYRRAAALSPDEPELLATIAVIAARLENAAEARELATRVLALRPGSINAHMAIARADLLEGCAEFAENRVTKLLERSDLDDEHRIGIHDLRADARDRLANTSGAFADYQARNAILERIYAPVVRRELAERRTDQARRLAAFFASTPADFWHAGADGQTRGAQNVRQHVFLVGFPRSGTTLLEKALAGHPDIVTLEEVDHLGDAGGRLLASNATLLELAHLQQRAADDYREAYWRGVRATFAADITQKTLIDKLPLHTPALPLISKLFPDAKILFALRDPRDVVLSCFRRRFRMNSAMYEFLTLPGAAHYYDEVMNLAEIYRRLLPLDIRNVRHETVVAGFEGELRQVLAFIGADWNPGVMNFAERARIRAMTPSDPQVARGLNSDGVGQWRRYAQELKPVFAILDPWVRHFGYLPAL